MRASLLLAGVLVLLAGEASAGTPAPTAPVREGTRYRCDALAAQAPSTSFFDTAVYQGDAGWFFRLDSDVTDFTVQAPQVVAMVGRLGDAFARRGVGLVYLPIPTRAMTDGARLPEGLADGVVYDVALAESEFHAMVGRIREAGVPTADMLAADSGGRDGDVHFARDTHWRPEGARRAATAVAGVIGDAGLLDGVVRTAFASHADGEATLVSPMARALQDLCQDALEPETHAVWQTGRTEVTADDLLGGAEDETAPVVLVGTSYSDIPAFNFAGFLSEALGVDVANHAVSGGGTWTSMLAFTHSPAMDGPLPRVVVWENPVAYRLDTGGVAALRQIIPAVHGPCTGASALLTRTITVGSGAAATVDVPAGVTARGHDHYLAFRLSDPSLRSFLVSLETRDGDGEDVAVSRPPRMGATDRAFVELSDDFAAPLASVAVSAAVDTPVEMTLDICRTGGDRS